MPPIEENRLAKNFMRPKTAQGRHGAMNDRTRLLVTGAIARVGGK